MRPLSRGFDPTGRPAKSLVSYQVLPTTSWVDPSSTGEPRRWGALKGLGSVRGVLQNRLRAVGHGMRVISDVTNPLAREHTMAKVQGKGEVIDIKDLLAGDAEFLRAAVNAVIEAALESEMTEAWCGEGGANRPGSVIGPAITIVR
jgi:hypothetical protein